MRGHEINAAIRFIDEQIKTEGTKRVLHMSDAALNDAKQALVDLEAKHSQLGLNRAGAGLIKFIAAVAKALGGKGGWIDVWMIAGDIGRNILGIFGELGKIA